MYLGTRYKIKNHSIYMVVLFSNIFPSLAYEIFSNNNLCFDFHHSAFVEVPLIGPRVKMLDGLRLCPMELINSTVKSRILPGVLWFTRKKNTN